MSNANVKNRTRAICEAAVFIALSLALGLLRFKVWAQGGSVDFSMLPLIIFALRWGSAWGCSAGAVAGLLRFVLLDGAAYGWQSLLIDYMLAYGACGLAGLLRSVEMGCVLACLVRFVMHLISGVVLFGMYMPSEYMGMKMNNVWIYSTLYNGSYMLPVAILTIMAIAILKVPLRKYLMPVNSPAASG